MDDLITEFITETSENIATLDQELVNLERNPQDHAILSNIFRLVHTIKGTCGFLGLSRLEKVAHASENVLGKIRDRKLEATPEAISLVLASLDCIRGLIEHLGAHGTEKEGDDADLVARLNHFAEHGVPGAQSAATATAVKKAEETAPSAVVQLPGAKPAPEPPRPPVTETEVKEGGAQTIRIHLDILEHMMQMVSELVLTRNQLMQLVRTKSDKDFAVPLQNLSHIATELQEEVMKTRMQPISNAWAKFPRLVRDLSLELGKRIELRMIGAETELDRQLLEMIKDPLTHMVRNSCDHGIEKPEDRRAAGKSEAGTIILRAFHEGGHVIIEIADDGKGIPIGRVREKAVANGLVSLSEIESMTEKQILQYIFAPGFSTAEKVTSVSGRGVGMDVVKTNIEKLGGAIELDSVAGKGSTFRLKIPLTLAIVSALIVACAGQKYAIPQISVSEVVRTGIAAGHAIEPVGQALVMRLRERLLPLATLAEVLGLRPPALDPEATFFVVVCQAGGFDFGLIVDHIYDAEEIVVKPVSEVLKSIHVYSGNTILGDGSVIMTLDPSGIANTFNAASVPEKKPENKVKAATGTDPVVSFLLFVSGSGAPKAVPLELVSRIEEIEAKTVEQAGDRMLVQYRGGLMRLISLRPPLVLPMSGLMRVIVFTYDNKSLGLVVDRVLDIAEAPFSLKMPSREKGYLGTAIMAGKATDVVDVGNLLSELVGMVDMSDVNVQKAKECHLLLVEDSPFYRNLTVPFLSAVGYRVTTAVNGAEALQMLQVNPKMFRIVVTDIEMPKMNGYQFASACRENDTIPRMPIVAYTSTVNGDTLALCQNAGINACIVKTDRGALLKAIATCLAGDREAA